MATASIYAERRPPAGHAKAAVSSRTKPRARLSGIAETGGIRVASAGDRSSRRCAERRDLPADSADAAFGDAVSRSGERAALPPRRQPGRRSGPQPAVGAAGPEGAGSRQPAARRGEDRHSGQHPVQTGAAEPRRNRSRWRCTSASRIDVLQACQADIRVSEFIADGIGRPHGQDESRFDAGAVGDSPGAPAFSAWPMPTIR